MDKKYISKRDKFIGYFSPKYLAKREAEVKASIEEDGGVRKLTLSELEKRMGITQTISLADDFSSFDNY